MMVLEAPSPFRSPPQSPTDAVPETGTSVVADPLGTMNSSPVVGSSIVTEIGVPLGRVASAA